MNAMVSAPTTAPAEECTRELHAALKANDAWWQAQKFVGMQSACEDGVPDYEMRNCRRCGSSLVRHPAHPAASPAAAELEDCHA